ncbi:hypothetical protein CTheo_6667 [Ceratobasidium theobromae]|uniref:Uncharacterized protein n=1 Tax=Ceratobasidium theobromae TaxID=1582974 RepID=A0A5N5QDY9_9AGAM|nr:hypothetical protein CTheo_6667 [Ceratobasidium theobromae]
MAENDNFIYLPAQASPSDEGPWYSIHAGLVTGIYTAKDWKFVRICCKSAPARQHLDPCWGKFYTWNQAVWHSKKGVELTVGSSLNLEEMERPTRYIQSAEILSTVWPPGSTIVIDDDDVVLSYTGHEPLPVTVTIMPRAGACLADPPNDENQLGHPPPPAPVPMLAPARNRAPTPALAPFLARTSSQPPLSQPQPILLSQSAPQISPPSQRALPQSSHPSTREVRTRLDTRSMVQAARAVSATKRALSPPPPTLVDPASRPTSPFASTAGSSQSLGWVYHQSTLVNSPSDTMSSPGYSPERQLEDNIGCMAGPSGLLQGSSSGAQPAPNPNRLPTILSETQHRLQALRRLRVEDQELESQITVHLVLCLLAMIDISPEGIDEIKTFAAKL